MFGGVFSNQPAHDQIVSCHSEALIADECGVWDNGITMFMYHLLK